MVDLDPHPDRRLAGLEDPGQGLDGGLFEQADEAWGAEHLDVAGAERQRRVGLTDQQPGFALESNRYVHRQSR